MSKMPKVALAITLASLTLGLLISGCADGSQVSTARVGMPAPDFELRNLDGESISLSGFKGKPVLLNFWNTGCPPCRAEMPYLQQVYNEIQEDNLVMLTVNIGERSATVERFLQDNDLSLPVLLDTKGAVAQLYIKRGIPTTVLIDKDGIIQEIRIGAFPSKESIENRLSKIMP